MEDRDRGIIGRYVLKLFFLVICGGSAATGVGMTGFGKILRNSGSPEVERPRARDRPSRTATGPRHNATVRGNTEALKMYPGHFSKILLGIKSAQTSSTCTTDIIIASQFTRTEIQCCKKHNN